MVRNDLQAFGHAEGGGIRPRTQWEKASSRAMARLANGAAPRAESASRRMVSSSSTSSETALRLDAYSVVSGSATAEP